MSTAQPPPQQPCPGTQAPEPTQRDPATLPQPEPATTVASSPCLLDSGEDFNPDYLPDFPQGKK